MHYNNALLGQIILNYPVVIIGSLSDIMQLKKHKNILNQNFKLNNPNISITKYVHYILYK